MRAWKSNEEVEIIFDESKKNRFFLVCKWDRKLPCCLFIMLNPSTADMRGCDPALDKCIKIAKFNGFGSISVVNLFSLRTPKPSDLLNSTERTLPKNREFIKEAIENADKIVAAWGEKGQWFNACFPVLKYLDDRGKDLYHLGVNKYGWPKHPLFIKADTKFKEYFFDESSSVGRIEEKR